MANNNKEKMNQQLDAQILELEQRFNQFLKELEEDFDFVPSAVANKHHKDSYDDDYPEFDNRLADMEKKYAKVDRKYTIVLTLTALLMLSVFGYLGYLLFGR
jgi:Rad3-related DNA helicase